MIDHALESIRLSFPTLDSLAKVEPKTYYSRDKTTKMFIPCSALGSNYLGKLWNRENRETLAGSLRWMIYHLSIPVNDIAIHLRGRVSAQLLHNCNDALGELAAKLSLGKIGIQHFCEFYKNDDDIGKQQDKYNELESRVVEVWGYVKDAEELIEQEEFRDITEHLRDLKFEKILSNGNSSFVLLRKAGWESHVVLWPKEAFVHSRKKYEGTELKKSVRVHLPTGECQEGFTRVTCSLNGLKKREADKKAGFYHLLKEAPGIVSPLRIYDRASRAPKRFFLMPYFELGDMGTVLRDRILTTREVETVARDLLEGLKEIHRQGIVHSNIEPRKVLLRNQQGQLHAALCGFRKAYQDKAEYIGGNVLWMSPEELCYRYRKDSNAYRKIGPASDMWSIGCLLYRLFIGAHTPWVEYMIEELQVGESKVLDPASAGRVIELMEWGIPRPPERTKEFFVWSLIRWNGKDRLGAPEALEALEKVCLGLD